MRATALEFRLRVFILFVIVAVGFWSPWLGGHPRISLLEWLSLELSRLGLIPFSVATPLVILLASTIALVAVVLRIWGTAVLGPEIVHDGGMQGDALVAAGPYRYVRNPLYLGTVLMMAAMCFAMPPTGALFTIVLVILFTFRLILGEEAFLTARLGEPYLQYARSTPRIFPLLRSVVPQTHASAAWGRAVVAEINSIGVFLTFAVLSWWYNNLLLIKAILISFGVWMVATALLPARREAHTDV